MFKLFRGILLSISVLVLVSGSAAVAESATAVNHGQQEKFIFGFTNGNTLKIIPKSRTVEIYDADGKKMQNVFSSADIERFYDNVNPARTPYNIMNWADAQSRSHYYTVTFNSKFISEFTIMEVDGRLFVINQNGEKTALDFSTLVGTSGFEIARHKIGEFRVSHHWYYQASEPGLGILKIIGQGPNGPSSHYFAVNRKGEIQDLAVIEASKKATVGMTDDRATFLDSKGVEFASKKISIYPYEINKAKGGNNYQVTLLEHKIVFNGKTPNLPSNDVTATNENGAKENLNDMIFRVFKDYTKENLGAGKETFALDEDMSDRIREGLESEESRNVVILGDAGSGKSETVRSFVKAVTEGKFPEIPVWTKFVEIHVDDIEAGTSLRGQAEARMKALMDYARNRDVILIIDEIDTLRGGGATGNESDIINKIESYLGDGSLRIIAMSKPAKFQNAFGGDDGLMRRFTLVNKPAFPDDMITQALADWAKTKKKEILPENIRDRIAFLSREFDAIASPLNKAVRLQDRFYAHLKIQSKIPGLAPANVTVNYLDKFAAKLYNIDPGVFDFEGRKELYAKYQKEMNKAVIGLPKAKAVLDFTAQRMASNQTTGSKTPQGLALLVGPAGVGKTFVPMVYAKSMGFNYKRIILSHYAGRTSEEFLIDIGRELEKSIFTVFLFDEVEKAPQYIQDILLAVTDAGTIAVSKSIDGLSGRAKSVVEMMTTKSTMFFATNAGADAVVANPNIVGEELKQAMLNDRNPLSEYFINRMKFVLVFTPPQTKEEFLAVVKSKYLEKLAEQKRQTGINYTVKNEDKFLTAIADEYFDPRSGFRQGITQVEQAIDAAVQKQTMTGSANSNALGSSCKLTLEKVSFSALNEKSINKKGGMGFTY